LTEKIKDSDAKIEQIARSEHGEEPESASRWSAIHSKGDTTKMNA
jgi:hypothetical protein